MTKELLERLDKIHVHNSHSKVESEALYAFGILSRSYGAIVEIGAALGRASIILASSTDKNVYCIDPWDNEIWSGITEPRYKDILNDDTLTVENAGDKVYEKFLENTKDFKNIIPIRGMRDTMEIKEPIGLVFVDGGHNYENVKVDLMFAKKWGAKFILVHDWGNHLDRDIPNACIDTLQRLPSFILHSLAVFIL